MEPAGPFAYHGRMADAFTAAQLETLRNAMLSPDKTIQFQGRMVQRREIRELLEAYDRAQYLQARSAGRAKSPLYVRLRGGW